MTRTLVGAGSSLDSLVGLDALQEVLVALALLDVLDADVDALGDDAVADALVDDDADGARRNVPDATGAAMVELVRHALVDGAVGLDINKVADLVVHKVGRQMRQTILTEGSRELGTRVRAVSR